MNKPAERICPLIDRRTFLALGALPLLGFASRRTEALPASVRLLPPMRPLPLGAVRLLDSPFLEAVRTNLRYLHSLDPDRLLHNFRTGAGLPPRAERYGGWEGDTIAGHTLGHYLSALALSHAQTGDRESLDRAEYIVGELALVQSKRGDGYVAGLLRKRKDGTLVDGQEIFTEIARGDIRSGGFDLNGAWSPLYTIHKLFAGLLDVHQLCGIGESLEIAIRLGTYFDGVFASLSDDELQRVLACEYGGLNESFAELYARTGDRRWLALARRIYDRRVLDPLEQQHDELANLHANTQVPKLVGLARLRELTPDESYGVAARFFWERVTGHHSFVIGGNGDREYFFEPDTISRHITEQTCEHCSSYNMLKLTRHLFAWQPDGRLFDYYERTHLNHILAQQHPGTGTFTYMTPLLSGAVREFSDPTDSFWCCVGTGMESHAKHGDSIFWEGGDTLLVNLYIPATAQWEARAAAVTLRSAYPFDGKAELALDELGKPGLFSIALRIPGWASSAKVFVNGRPVEAVREAGYAIVTRRWRSGDTISLELPLDLRIEATADDPDTITIMRGPLALAADLGPRDAPFEGPAPALVSGDVLSALEAHAGTRVRFDVPQGLGRPGNLRFVPFYSQYDRRSAVYFKRFTDAAWAREEAAFMAEQARQRALAARSVDVMHLGEMQPERDHRLTSEQSWPVVYRGRNGRDARSGGYFEFTMKVRPGPLLLQAVYWGDERGRDFEILIDGTLLARQALNGGHPGAFFEVDYAIPQSLIRGRSSVRVRFQPRPGKTAGPVFGVRLLTQ